jgi:hypothetical protein
MQKYCVWIVIALLLSGCVRKSKFVYEPPAGGLDNGKGKIVGAVARIEDRRVNTKEFDKFYEGDPVKDIQSMLEHELLGTDVFKEIIPVTDSTGLKADVMVEPVLQKLQWEVPDYESLKTKAFFVGFFTGIIGGTIYGYTDTDVYGDSGMYLRVTDVASGKVLLNKSYKGHYQQEIIKFKCDTPETRVMVAEKSLQKALGAMKSELAQTLLNQGQERLMSVR